MKDIKRPEETGKLGKVEEPEVIEKSEELGNAPNLEETKVPEKGKKQGEISVNTPHDKGYKKSLSKPREFLHFLRKYVKADWMMELKESDLILCDKEMLERDYEGKEADLIYRVNMPEGKEIFIFILQELQSYVDHTMVFHILVYVVNTLVKHFLDVDKKARERADFRLPAIVPIVFYNGAEPWNAVTDIRSYQNSGEIFGNHILNLEYYLVNLADIREEYILSTNTVLDNIMYCDKFRKKLELVGAIRTAYDRVQDLGLQEQEEFRNWAKYILLSVCGNKEAVVKEVMSWAGNGEGDMAFQYTIIRVFEEERAKCREEGRAEGREVGRKEGREEGREEGKVEGRAQGKAEGKAEDIVDLLAELSDVPEKLKNRIYAQKDLDILRNWHKLAAHAQTIEEFEEHI